jgi:hypothetical protein
MTTYQPFKIGESIRSPGQAFRRLSAVNRLLTVVAAAHFGLLLFFIVGLLVDPRLVTGAPAWLKPAKFAFSIGLYSITVLWMLSYVSGHRRLVNVVASIIAIGFVFEMVGIAGQAARGVGSHFNIATPLDSLIYSVMGTMIAIVTLMLLLVAGLLVRQKGLDIAFRWGLILALLGTMAGSFMAFGMTAPKPEQQLAWENGAPPVAAGGHAVGVPEDGPGLPILGWSMEGGDLRAAHFLGIHAMQVLPFAGWLASRRWTRRRLTGTGRALTVVSGTVAYLGAMTVLFWQAMRGQSIIAPDGLTMAGFGIVALLSLVILFFARMTRMTKTRDREALAAPVQEAG